MSRRTTLFRLLAALVGVVAIAFAAATIENPTETGGDGGDGGEGSGPAQEPMSEGSSWNIDQIPDFLEYLAIALVVLVAIAFAWYLLTHRREALRYIATISVFALLFLAVIMALVYVDPGGVSMNESAPPGGGMPNETDPGDPGEGDGSSESIPGQTFLIVLAAIATIFVGALVVSKRGARAAAGAIADHVESTEEDAAAVAAAAGRAAERIEESEDESVDNEVYRAWRDMTRLLEVDRPETSTPGEFATAAIDAGLADRHVDELTTLFEDVRYGHTDTTDEMERRAVSVLRRIEDEYAGDEETVDSPVGGGRS